MLKLSTAQAQATAVGRVVARQVCSDNERDFFYRLCRALPEFHVFPQVAANALLEVDRAIEFKKRGTVRNRYAQQHVDFVVCERDTLKVLAIIELDDKTHRSKKDKDKARDAMFEQAGYVTHRFESRRKPSDAEIAGLFAPPRLPAPSQDERF